MRRRKFINIGSIAAGSLLVGMHSKPYFVNSPNDEINLGIIGTGSRGMGLMKSLAEIQGINITACCDELPFRLEAALSLTNNKAKAYNDYRLLLEDKDVDAVLISVPFGLHAKMALDALEAEKHVYCEKTMARGFSDTQQLVKKVEQTGKIFQTGHQYHSSRMYVDVVEKIKEGMVGEITAVQSQWNRNGDWRRPVPDPKWEKQINWRMYKKHSGGLIAELCAHQIDFCNWIMEDKPMRILGTGGINHWKDGRETYDNIHMIHEYPSGVKATYVCTTTNSLNDYKIKVLGNEGSIVLDYDKAWFFPEAVANKKLGVVDGVSGATISFEREKGYEFGISHNDPSLQALMDFKDNILNNETPTSNVVTGGHVAMAVQMSLNAVHTKTVQKWEDSFNLEN